MKNISNTGVDFKLSPIFIWNKCNNEKLYNPRNDTQSGVEIKFRPVENTLRCSGTKSGNNKWDIILIFICFKNIQVMYLGQKINALLILCTSDFVSHLRVIVVVNISHFSDFPKVLFLLHDCSMNFMVAKRSSSSSIFIGKNIWTHIFM